MSGGRLAIWNDCLDRHRDAYEDWYTGEHLPERLGLPGFQRGRRYAATAEGPEYFTYYEVTRPEDLIAPVYLERVNNPSPQTRFIMAEAFRNMSRTICTVAERHGRMRGAWAVTRTLAAGEKSPDPAELATRPGVARTELWRQAPLDAPSENAESRLRGGDVTVDGCLFVETVRQSDAQAIADRIGGAHVWQFLCELEATSVE